MARNDQHTEVSEATRKTEDREAHSDHGADRPVNAPEEAVLDDEPVDQDVREHYRDMTARGAADKGEGRIP